MEVILEVSKQSIKKWDFYEKKKKIQGDNSKEELRLGRAWWVKLFFCSLFWHWLPKSTNGHQKHLGEGIRGGDIITDNGRYDANLKAFTGVQKPTY